MTVDQVSELLNVRASTVYEWARMGYIPCIRMGTGDTRPLVRFSREAIEAWVEEKSSKGRRDRVPMLLYLAS